MRATIGALVVAVAALVASLTTSSPAPRSTPLTLYVGPAAPGALRRAAAALGARPTRASDFFNGHSWATMTNRYTERPWTHSGYRMIWGIPMLPASGASLRAGAAGRYDHYWTTMARQLVAARQADAILRLGAEFNVPGHPWYAGGQAPAFVAYWRHVVRSMNAVRGAHFAYLWNPNIGDSGPGDAAIGNLAAYYPGNAYVDYVGLDLYDIAWQTYPGASKEFRRMLTAKWGLGWLANFSAWHRKPIMLPEFGLGWGVACRQSGPCIAHGRYVDGGDDPVWVSDVLTWSRQHHARTVVFWDQGSSAIPKPNGRTFAVLKRYAAVRWPA